MLILVRHPSWRTNLVCNGADLHHRGAFSEDMPFLQYLHTVAASTYLAWHSSCFSLFVENFYNWRASCPVPG